MQWRVYSMRGVLQEDAALSMGGAGDAVSAEVEQIYGALLHGPKKQGPTEGMRLPLRTPGGTKALSEAIHALLEGHIEYIHQAHHHLLPVRPSPVPILSSSRPAMPGSLSKQPLTRQQSPYTSRRCISRVYLVTHPG